LIIFVINVISIFLFRCEAEGRILSKTYYRIKQNWIYILSKPFQTATSANIGAETFFLCICSKFFNPDFYFDVLNIFSEKYSIVPDPTKIIEGYLHLHTTGKLSTITISNYSEESVMKGFSTNLKYIVKRSGVEVVLIWNAVVLQQRILVYRPLPPSPPEASASSLSLLMQTARSLVSLAPSHRRDLGSLLRPLVAREDASDLSESFTFVACSSDSSLLARYDLFDLLVALPPDENQGGESAEIEITVSPAAKAAMALCPAHRELAQVLTDLVDRESTTEQQLLATFADKAEEARAVLVRALFSGEEGKKEKLSEAAFLERMVSVKEGGKATQQWLRRIATAEGFV
jgi:hypothetical protein